MKHLTEEELIEHYYGESTAKSGVAHHLELCGECAKSYETLRKDLEGIELSPVPQRGPEFGDQVWEKIRHSLPAYQQPQTLWSRIWNWKYVGYALTCAVLLITAFLGGRYWERHQTGPRVAENSPTGKQRVVLLVLGDHLDRSERLLVELNHANTDDPTLTKPIQSEARKLLTDNRLYLQSSDISTDPLLSGPLDQLERVLIEVANDPNGLSHQDIARLQKEMNTKGLLFEIRVLKAKTAHAANNEENIKKGLVI